MKRPYLLLLILVLLVSACGDDDPATPEGFKVTIAVTDPGGNPVEGLDLSLTMDTDFFQDGVAIEEKQNPPGRPAVVIPFEISRECVTRLVIEDITGTEVRLLGHQVSPAGSHQWMWNGLDDKGEGLPSGVYYAYLRAFDGETEQEVINERKIMLMAIIDPARHSVGTTDADGKITLTDERLFPALFEVEDIPAVDESAEPMGTIEITPTMRFYLADLVNGGGHRFYRDVTASTTFEITWDPARMADGNTATVFPAREKADVDPIPLHNRLRQPFPVPFN